MQDEQPILDACTRILRDLLGDDDLTLKMDTRREDVPDWDSFAYINFIALVEAEYGVKFRIAEVESFENVGAIVHRIRTLRAAR
jgi:acyl carrier protein